MTQTLSSVSTLSVNAFEAWVAAAGGAPLSKCERSPTPPQRAFVDSPLLFMNALTRSRSRTRSPSPSPSSLEPTTPMDRYDQLDYGFEVEEDQLFSYDEPCSPRSHSPKKPSRIAHVHAYHPLERCTGARDGAAKSPSRAADADNPPGPPTPLSLTAAQRCAAAYRASVDVGSPSTGRTRTNSWDWYQENDEEGDEGVIWFGKRKAPSAERVELFQNWVGMALDSKALPPQQSSSCDDEKKSPQLMKRIVGAWRRRRRSTK